MNTLIRRLVERAIQNLLQRGVERGVQGGLRGLRGGCGSRWWVLLLVAVLGCCLVVGLSSGILSGIGGLLGGGGTGSTSGGAIEVSNGVRVGRLVTATATNRDGCADGRTSRFRGDESIWVVAESSDFPRGTRVFMRLYRGTRAVEDADEITAEQDYRNACVAFVFEASRSAGALERGDYEAELFVNGNAAGSVKFTVD